jgi:hypothetical protein
MTTTSISHIKEEHAVKKILLLTVVTVALIALTAAPAFAEAQGYNDSGEYTRDNGYFSGPHGGYTTTTNKCAVCHSTHYAEGSFMLLRANSREAACDYCHGGGGGSNINIQMDNAYKTMTEDFDVADGVVDVANTPTGGYGTGHTLGYTGMAPTDIKPAYQAANGFACFDCHSPHGNSERIMGVTGNPGRTLGTDNIVVPMDQPPYIGNSTDGILNSGGEWGVDPKFGNFKWFGDPWAAGGRPADDTAGARLIYRPIFPAGRFMLIKDPHSTAKEGRPDTDTPRSVFDDVTALATDGLNKIAINWDEPMGPADGGYGGGQDNDSDQPFLFAPKDPVTGDGGFAALSEFCIDCHDGTGGASTQAAEVWNSVEGTYTVSYSHDVQPRH